MKKKILVALLGTLVLAVPASAQNLLTNPDFPTDLSGWTPAVTGTASATFLGGIGSAALGAADLGADQDGIVTLSQCVAVTALSLYDLRTDTHTVSGAGQNGVLVRFFSGAGCTGTDLGAFPTDTVVSVPNPADGTSWLRRSRTSLAAPAGAVSARVELLVSVISSSPSRKPQGIGFTAEVYFDHAFLGATGTPVTLQSIDTE